VVVDADGLVMLVQLEIHERRVFVERRVCVQVSDVTPRIGGIAASFGRRVADGVLGGQPKVVIVCHLGLFVVHDHATNGCDATIAACNSIASLYVADFLGLAIRHLDLRLGEDAHRRSTWKAGGSF
jgi:hypothetical protein